MVRIPRTTLEQIDLEATLQLILKNAVKALGGSAGVVAIWDEAEHRFVPSASCGMDPDALEQLQPLLAEAAPDLASSRESYDLLSELWPDQELPLSETGIRQNPIIALPLKIGEKSIGLIYVLRPINSKAFSKIDQPVLAAFAEQAAIAVQNAKLAYLLSEEKQRIEAVLENSAEGIMSIDSQCRILGFNSAMEKLTEYSRDEVISKECFRILNFEDAEHKNLCSQQCPMLMRFSEYQPIFEQEGKIRTRSGRTVDVAMMYSIVRSPEGQPINAVVNVRDISRMRENENLRETILAMLGHELQTPLAIIKGYTSTLSRADGRWDVTTIRQSLQAIEEESDRLSKVMNQLLLASRLSAGVFKLEKEPVRMSSMVQKVVRRMRRLTQIHNFEIKFGSRFPLVTVEPQLIEQVLSNLIENAIKYSPQGGKVTISGRKTGNEVRVSVADEGIGISSIEMEHLFEKFHRADKGQAQKIEGVGLGLYICKSIIEAHGGTMEAHSQAGKGSEFIFTLPLENEERHELA